MQLGHIEGNEIAIKGNIKTIGDYQELKGYVNKLIDAGEKEIHIKIVDSYTITSSVVGFLFKVINLNTAKIFVEVRDERLYRVFDDLRLIEAFNVSRIS